MTAHDGCLMAGRSRGKRYRVGMKGQRGEVPLAVAGNHCDAMQRGSNTQAF